MNVVDQMTVVATEAVLQREIEVVALELHNCALGLEGIHIVLASGWPQSPSHPSSSGGSGGLT